MEKPQNDVDALKEFVKNFPQDIYGQIILEELLKILMEDKGKNGKK